MSFKAFFTAGDILSLVREFANIRLKVIRSLEPFTIVVFDSFFDLTGVLGTHFIVSRACMKVWNCPTGKKCVIPYIQSTNHLHINVPYMVSRSLYRTLMHSRPPLRTVLYFYAFILNCMHSPSLLCTYLHFFALHFTSMHSPLTFTCMHSPSLLCTHLHFYVPTVWH